MPARAGRAWTRRCGHPERECSPPATCLHGAEPADIAALSGRHAAAAAAAHVRGSEWPETRVPIECDPPLHWIAPNAITARGVPPRGRFLLRSREFVSGPRIQIVQDERVLWDGRIRRLVPVARGRCRTGWTTAVDPAAGPVRVRAVTRG